MRTEGYDEENWFSINTCKALLYEMEIVYKSLKKIAQICFEKIKQGDFSSVFSKDTAQTFAEIYQHEKNKKITEIKANAVNKGLKNVIWESEILSPKANLKASKIVDWGTKKFVHLKNFFED